MARFTWKRRILYQYKIVSLSSSGSVLVCLIHLLAPKDEAFAAKHMPDLGHDVKDFKVFSWPLNNWKKLDKKLTSPEFECGGHKWCVLSRLVVVCMLHLSTSY